jgi:type I restriction enzyme M protein
MLDHVPMEDRDTKGDLYEYMLGKIAAAGQNGQFRTPRHIIKLMVALTPPRRKDTICDPASGTCGFLVAAGIPARTTRTAARDAPARTSTRHVPRLRLRQHHAAHRQHEHGAARRRQPGHRYKDSLAEDHAGDEAYSLILANPPLRAAWTTRTPPKTCWPSSRPRRPSCCSWPCSCAC